MELPKPKILKEEVLLEAYAVVVDSIDWKIRAAYLQDVLPFDLSIVFGWYVAEVILIEQLEELVEFVSKGKLKVILTDSFPFYTRNCTTSSCAERNGSYERENRC